VATEARQEFCRAASYPSFPTTSYARITPEARTSIDLSLVRYRSLNPSAAQRPLPYEMIVDGIYNAAVQPE
jgi:hypothetical protein